MIERSGSFVVAGLLLCPCLLLGNGLYVGYSTFQEWVQLAPEVLAPEACGLTSAAHNLWAQKQLRVPEATFMVGDFSGTGRMDWIVQLHQATSPRPCEFVLIVSHENDAWARLFFKEIRSDGASWSLVWFSKRRAIAIDGGERRRRSVSAEMHWSEEEKWSRPGYVVEDLRVRSWIEWDTAQKAYVYKSSEDPQWWEIEQE